MLSWTTPNTIGTHSNFRHHTHHSSVTSLVSDIRPGRRAVSFSKEGPAADSLTDSHGLQLLRAHVLLLFNSIDSCMARPRRRRRRHGGECVLRQQHFLFGPKSSSKSFPSGALSPKVNIFAFFARPGLLVPTADFVCLLKISGCSTSLYPPGWFASRDWSLYFDGPPTVFFLFMAGERSVTKGRLKYVLVFPFAARGSFICWTSLL